MLLLQLEVEAACCDVPFVFVAALTEADLADVEWLVEPVGVQHVEISSLDVGLANHLDVVDGDVETFLANSC